MNRRRFISTATALAATPLIPRISWAADRPTAIVRPGKARAALLGPGKPETEVWAYGGTVPGPVLRIPQGEPVHFRLENGLDTPTTVHWHGIRLANAMDGVPGMTQDPVAPGASFDYRFTAPDAGTYWYHSHARAFEQVDRGLYGLLIVEEKSPPAVDSDRVFMVDDWRLGEDGVMAEGFGNLHDAAHGGRLGNWLTVNGATEPALAVRPGERLRLRCISAASARIMAFRFPGVTASVVAFDGQPLETPYPLAEPLVLASAQRADLIIDIPADAAPSLNIEEVSTGDAVVAATFAVSGQSLRDRASDTPVKLPANPLPQLDLAAPLTVDLVMEGGAMGGLREVRFKDKMYDLRTLATEYGKVWAFNGVAGDAVEPLLRAPRGRTVIVNLVNQTRWPHAMHLHGHHFRVIERNGTTIGGALWRDTELLEPDDRVRIAFVADNPGKWLFHCHMLSHHMAGMGTWIDVA